MTTYNKQTLATFFQTGDVPTGTDYENLIDSQVNIAETSTQAMAGSLSVNELVAARVSAGNLNITGIISAASFSVDSLTTGNIVATTLVAGSVSAQSVNVAVDISAGGSVYANASRAEFNFHGSPVIVSAAGTAQATGALLAIEMPRLQGATDGVSTGFRLLSNMAGWAQYLANECSVSANLWPPVGGRINGLANNAAFPMAANTPYIVMHVTASAYSVK